MQLHWQKAGRREIDHELVWLSVSLGGGSALATWLALQLPTPPCPFHALTGFPCVTCGATRAALNFFRGHFGTSALFNPLAFAVFCGLLIFDLYALVVLVTRAPRLRLAPFSRAEKNLARAAALLLLAGNWLYLLLYRPV